MLDSKNDQIIQVVTYALRNLRVKVTAESITQLIKSHYDYPSFNSICDALSEWGIVNKAVKLKLEDLPRVDSQLFIHLNKKNQQVVAYLIQAVPESHVILFNGEKTQISWNEFMEIYTGVAILFEKGENSGEIDYYKKRKVSILEKTVLLLYPVAFLSTCSYLTATNNYAFTTDYTIIVTKFLGFFFSVILVLKSRGTDNRIDFGLCQINEKIDCNSVLTSKGATIFGWLKWADAGLIYFTYGIFTLCGANDESYLYIPQILSILVIPYTLYSLYYQAIVLKKWCMFCLLVQLVLLSEFILALTSLSPTPLSFGPALFSVNMFVLSVMLVLGIRGFDRYKSIATMALADFKGFRNQPLVLQSLLQKTYRIDPKTIQNAFRFGEGKIVVTMFLSIDCGACLEALRQLQKLNNQLELSFELIFRFKRKSQAQVLLNDLNTLSIQRSKYILRHLITTFSKNLESPKDTGVGNTNNMEWVELEDQVKEHENMILSNKITKTPTIFINYKLVPNGYSMNEIIYILGKNH